jgi:hypothetical protein
MLMATISRLYRDYDTGARVVAELERAGIPHSDISIIANNESGWFDRDGSKRIDRDADGTDDRAEGAAAGAGIGARSAVSRGCLLVLACWPFPASGLLWRRGGSPRWRQPQRPAGLLVA